MAKKWNSTCIKQAPVLKATISDTIKTKEV